MSGPKDVHATGVHCTGFRLLSSAQWQHDKRIAALDARRRSLERDRHIRDVSDMLERLDSERRVYGQHAFNAWLRKRRLTAVPAVVDRLGVAASSCGRDHRVNASRVWVDEIFV